MDVQNLQTAPGKAEPNPIPNPEVTNRYVNITINRADANAAFMRPYSRACPDFRGLIEEVISPAI
jgi:hypothetical protein